MKKSFKSRFADLIQLIVKLLQIKTNKGTFVIRKEGANSSTAGGEEQQSQRQ